MCLAPPPLTFPLSETLSETLSAARARTKFATNFPTKTGRANGDAKHVRSAELLLGSIRQLGRAERDLGAAVHSLNGDFPGSHRRVTRSSKSGPSLLRTTPEIDY
jgi:hypothetical protein